MQYRHGFVCGFSLLELLVSLAILAMIAAISAPSVMRYFGGARSDTAGIELETLGTAIEFYRLGVGRYPENLQALIEKPANVESWNGPYLSKKVIPRDPWGYEYLYRYPGEHGVYDLYTLGADNAEGGEGEDRDIVNWK